MRRSIFWGPILAPLAVLVLGASSALAGNSPVVNTTYHYKDVEVSFPGDDPCTGEAIWVSERETGSAHEMMLADGSVAVSGGFRAEFLADTDGDGAYDLAGRYTLRYNATGMFDPATGAALGRSQNTFTWNGEYWSLDGGPSTRFHQTMHLGTGASGDPMHAFFKTRCW